MKNLLHSFLFIFSSIVPSWAQSARPNVLVILTDDQGYYDVAACGATDLQTPNMDKLFADGMKFNYFYANSCVCSPTRASLLSGIYPDKAGVPGVIRTHANDNWGYLKSDIITLADAFRRGGYETAMVGKWHLGLGKPNIPTMRGFDVFKGYLGDMMDDYFTHRRHGINYMRSNEQVVDPKGHATDIFTQWAVDYLNQRPAQGKPFFFYLAYNAPHFPVQPPADWLDKVKKRQPKLSEKRAKLVALIEHLDAGIGRVIQTLKDKNMYDNTLIVFTSDNGGHLPSEANNGPLRDGKGSMYEGGLRVPAAVVWKNHIIAGSMTDQPVVTMDIYPTVLSACGITYSHSIDGLSFLPVLLDHQQDMPARDTYFVRREGGTRYGGLTIQAVIKGGWKLLQNTPFESQELYNLLEDPYETINLIESEKARYHDLNKLLMQHIQQGGQVPWQKP